MRKDFFERISPLLSKQENNQEGYFSINCVLLYRKLKLSQKLSNKYK